MRKEQTEKVVSYTNREKFLRDAKRLERKGWSVHSVTSHQPRPGCARILLLGFFAGIFKPKPLLMVVYRRERVL